MNWVLKKFSDITKDELYAILQLRSEVFVVEQDCVYQDLDGKDQSAYHLFARNEKQVLAYARLFDHDIKYPNSSSIGRVVVKETKRKHGLGKELINRAIDFLKKAPNYQSITISAQCYLDSFYTDLGFEKVGKEYLEDNIPHQKMIYAKK